VALTAGAAMLFTGALTGCSGGDKGDEKITLTVQALTEWAPMMDVLKPKFEEKYPNITVESQLPAHTNQVVAAQVIAGNNPPDIAWASANTDVYANSLAAGVLLPLDDVWEKANLDARYGPSTAASLKAADGKPYVVALHGVLYALVYYNKALFAEIGLPEPEDHRIPDQETLYSMIDTIRAANYQPLAVVGNGPGMFGHMVDQLLQNAASEDQMANYLTNFQPEVEVTANYTDAPFVDTLAQIKEWGDRGLFQDGYTSQDPQTAEALFIQGKAAMMLGGSWNADNITNAGMDFDWVLLPPINPDAKMKVASFKAEAVAIPKNAKHPEEAKLFLEFLMTDEMQRDAVAATGTALPAVITVDPSTLDNLNPTVQSILSDVSVNDAPVGWTSAAPGSFAQTVGGGAALSAAIGEKTVDQGAEEVQGALAEIRAE
jgi:raffinose/stachyose/melibiose transport system substrate-binding protein